MSYLYVPTPTGWQPPSPQPPPQYAAPPYYAQPQPAPMPGGAVYPATPPVQWQAPQLQGNHSRELAVRLTNDIEGVGRAGQLVTLAATPDDIIEGTGEEDATYLGGYKNSDFRADEASPIIPTDLDKGFQRNFTLAHTFRRVNTKVSREAPPPEVSWSSDTIDWALEDECLGDFINDITVQNAQGHGKALDPELASLDRLGNGMGLERECGWWELATTVGTWTTANRRVLGVGFEWNEGASSDPIKDIQDMCNASAQKVTGIFLGQNAAFALTRNPAVKDWLGTMRGQAGTEGNYPDRLYAAVEAGSDFSFPTLPPFHIVGGKVLNEVTSELDDILSTDVVGISRPAGIPRNGEAIATSYTYARRMAGGVNFETRRFRLDMRGPKGGTMIVAYRANCIVVPGPNVGFLIKNAYRP
jgi:hypothetical protein